MRSKYIDHTTVEKLRSEIGAFRWLPMRISEETGLRIGDVLALEFGQIRRRAGRPEIRATAAKTGKAGNFPISEALFQRLRKLPGSKNKHAFVFPSYGKTGHLTRQAAWARMKRAAEDLGISPDGISPHSLRKCFAVALMHERGIEAVQAALQHQNDAVTRVYAYADTIMRFDSDAPVRWRDVELIVDYIISRIHEKEKK